MRSGRTALATPMLRAVLVLAGERMLILQTILVVATMLCWLVADILFAFATVVMPGIKGLDDGAFIRAFQVIDAVIQGYQPLFLLVWIGSALSTIAAEVIGGWRLAGLD